MWSDKLTLEGIGSFVFSFNKPVHGWKTMRVVKHWNRLPRDAVDAPSLEVLKSRVDGALSNLVWWEVSLPMAGGVGIR